MENQLLNVGDIVSIVDNVDLDTTTTATIRLIEQDNDMEGLFWYYLVANKEEYNSNFDPRIGNFWRIIENISPLIMPLAQATTN